MGNRFHNKYHRHNHHSAISSGDLYPDSAFDPIASRESPFKGEFYTEGSITTTQSISAKGVISSPEIQATTLSAANIVQRATFETLSADKTFTIGDTSKTYHFDTNTASLTAFFPGALTTGFITKIANVGTNTLHLSAPSLTTDSSTLSQYAATSVYKLNTGLFAIRGI